MSKKKTKSQVQALRELPRFYPRTEEIIIFSDMGELDHVFELLDNVKESAKQAGSKVTFEEWKDRLDWSVVYGLIHRLRKVCGEYERYWIDHEDWRPEDDDGFMEAMNDPDELQWRVTEIDMNIQRYDPAYHAAAESLQMAMYTYKYPGDKEWVEYCVNRLRQTLTRYHAASLEIAMHRDNVYLQNNSENLETARKIRERSRRRAGEQKEEAKQLSEKIANLFKEKLKNKKSRETREALVIKVCEEIGVGEAKVWRALKEHGLTKNRKSASN